MTGFTLAYAVMHGLWRSATEKSGYAASILSAKSVSFAENGRYPPTQNGDIRSLFMLFTLLAMQN